MPSLSRVLALLLTLGLPGATLAGDFAQAYAQAERALEQLKQLIGDQADQLVLSVPNRPVMPLSLFMPICSPPHLLGLGDELRAVSNCLVGGHSGVMLWEQRDGQWARGTLLARQRTAFGQGTVATPNWRDLESRARWARPISRMAGREIEQWPALWQTLRERPALDYTPSLHDTPERWPHGLAALHRDGRLMLSGRGLAGLADWQQWMARQQWSDAVVGVSSADVTEKGYARRKPGLLLETLTLGGAPYGLVLLEGEHVRAAFALWKSAHRQLVLEPLTDDTRRL